jgi:hypothetical protein
MSLMIFLSASVVAQSTKSSDSIDYYIRKLSWQSLYLKTTYATELVLNGNAEKLIIKDDAVARKLIGEITDKKKTVVVHMILSKIYTPEAAQLQGQYSYKDDAIVGVNYVFNTLTWRYDVKKEQYTIQANEVKRIKRFWEEKLKAD